MTDENIIESLKTKAKTELQSLVDDVNKTQQLQNQRIEQIKRTEGRIQGYDEALRALKTGADNEMNPEAVASGKTKEEKR